MLRKFSADILTSLLCQRRIACQPDHVNSLLKNIVPGPIPTTKHTNSPSMGISRKCLKFSCSLTLMLRAILSIASTVSSVRPKAYFATVVPRRNYKEQNTATYAPMGTLVRK